MLAEGNHVFKTFVQPYCMKQTNSRVSRPVTDLQRVDSLYCPATTDSYSCWDKTPAGYDAVRSCPWYVAEFDRYALAYKTCTDTGVWDLETNYSDCLKPEYDTLRQLFQAIEVKCNIVSSIFALSLLILIYTHNKPFTNRRMNLVHITSSFVMFLNHIAKSIWYAFIDGNSYILLKYEERCVIFRHIIMLLIVSNFFLMFLEKLSLYDTICETVTPIKFLINLCISSIPISIVYYVYRKAISEPAVRVDDSLLIAQCYVGLLTAIGISKQYKICIISQCGSNGGEELPEENLSPFKTRKIIIFHLIMLLDSPCALYFFKQNVIPAISPAHYDIFELVLMAVDSSKGVLAVLIICIHEDIWAIIKTAINRIRNNDDRTNEDIEMNPIPCSPEMLDLPRVDESEV